MNDDLIYRSARDIRNSLLTGALDPIEYLDALYRRVDEVNGEVNAVTESLKESAYRAAAESQDRLRQGEARALEGIPVAIKEEHPIEGVGLRLGSSVMPEEHPDHSHPIVERIIAAGGIPHLRTTTPEFCAAIFTQSELWGVTSSAWNRAYSSGGSSGGSGAALAAGMAPLATGSDIAGSLRIPGAFNGIVGYKAPYATVPSLAPANLDTYCHDGAMARSPQDARMLHDVIAGRHPLDHVSVTSVAPERPADRPRRIAVSRTLGPNLVSRDVLAAVDAAAETLSARGYEIVDAELDWNLSELVRPAFGHLALMMAPLIRGALGAGYTRANSYARDMVERGEEALAELGTLGVTLAEAGVQEQLAELFTRVDALVCPTMLVAGLEAGNDYIDTPVMIDGTPVDVWHSGQVAATFPFNMASRCPAITVPSTITSIGIPGSVQVVGAPYDEAIVFEVAADIYAAADWYSTPQLRPVFGR